VEEERPAHPPVGKWAIAAGIALTDDDPVGWRLASAVAGTATVLLTYLLGLRLLGGSRLLAGLAGLLVAIDGIALTMSRIAMLDVFLGLFVVAACWALVRARDASEPRAQLGWRVGAGVFLGLAVGTKWSGGLALLAALVVVGVGELRRRRTLDRPDRPPLRRTLARIALPLVAVPALVYVASYAGWFAAYPSAGGVGQERFACPEEGCDDSLAGTAEAWVDEQLRTVRFHRDLIVSHPYRSPPVGWPVLARPVLTYLERCEDGAPADEPCQVAEGNKAKILVVGNPGMWWPALLAYPVLAWAVVVRRDGRAAVLGAFLVLQWAPWLLSPKNGYLFYLVPVVPFVALTVAFAVGRLPGRRLPRGVGAAVTVTALAGAAFLLPLWLGWELSEAASDARLLLSTWR
jgi:dolichyl-phosphate-mannose--protein O-mannosyl transferase